MKELKIIYLPPEELTPYAHNAKRHPDDQVEHIANSIREFGFRQPIVVDADNVVVIGHGRLLAAQKLGLDAVPVVRADDLTEAQIKALRLADNKTNESEWDFGLLDAELVDLALDFDMSDFGFDDIPGGVSDTTTAAEDDFDPEEPVEPKAKLGDIYQLGRHQLMCGDSTDPNAVDALLNGTEIDLLLTDPPYNVNLGSIPTPTETNIRPIMNDNMDEDDFIHFLSSALWNAERHMRAGAAYYIWYAGLHHIEFESAIRNVEAFKIHEQLVWVKSHFVLGRNSDYQWMHEPCLYGWKAGAEHYFTDSRAESTVIEDEQVKLSTMKKGDLIQLCERLMGLNQANTILRADRPMSADMHPTVKPQTLLVPLIRNSSKRGWNVLDLFGGSGSTLIACEQTGRNCYMMELDPHYVDVIIARWEKLTGEKAVLLN